MAKVRVYELAKEFGVESKVVLAKLGDLGEFVRSASSTVEAPVVRKLKEAFADAPPPAPAKKAAAAKTAAKTAAKKVSVDGSTSLPAPVPVVESAPAACRAGAADGSAGAGAVVRPAGRGRSIDGPEAGTSRAAPGRATSRWLSPRQQPVRDRKHGHGPTTGWSTSRQQPVLRRWHHGYAATANAPGCSAWRRRATPFSRRHAATPGWRCP